MIKFCIDIIFWTNIWAMCVLGTKISTNILFYFIPHPLPVRNGKYSVLAKRLSEYNYHPHIHILFGECPGCVETAYKIWY